MPRTLLDGDIGVDNDSQQHVQEEEEGNHHVNVVKEIPFATTNRTDMATQVSTGMQMQMQNANANANANPNANADADADANANGYAYASTNLRAHFTVSCAAWWGVQAAMARCRSPVDFVTT